MFSQPEISIQDANAPLMLAEEPRSDGYLSTYEPSAPPPAWRRYVQLALSPFIDDSGEGLGLPTGLLTIGLVGTILGLSLPKDSDLPHGYSFLSNIIGYTYFVAWSISFYPQIITNIKRQSTRGLSVDFCALNVLGFACYTAYTVSFFFAPEIEREYKERNGNNANITVQTNDVAFCIHALVLSSISLIQIGVFGGAEALQLSKTTQYIMGGILFVAFFYLGLVLIDLIPKFNWLNYLYFLSYIKIVISIIKYVPQVVLNFNRKSTSGWSVWNILLDLTGGLLSNLQLILDCHAMHNWAGITGNPAKLGLGTVSILFDIIFLIQHYVLYRGNQADDEHSILLPQEEDERFT
jgi:cystinosin